ncbi:SAR2788 family putative toxin (plasmid) [Exiguobacterium acetylicum]|uniref:SAR2788 family putative toxin n=1 Tax=Exiguobacterium acetylicum TaxID=41170 RepID=UPI0035A6E347
MKKIIKLICMVMIFSMIGPNLAVKANSIKSNEINALENTNELYETKILKDTDEEKQLKVNVENEGLLVNSIVELTDDESSKINTEIYDPETNEKTNYEFEIKKVEYTKSGEPNLTLVDIKTGKEYVTNDTQIQSSWYPLVVIAIFVARVGMKQAIKKFGKSSVNKAVKKHGSKTSASNAVRTVKMSKLDAHYDKHKKEFSKIKGKYITKSQYLNKARTLLGKATSKTVLEKKSKKKFNGKYRYYKYNKDTNEFLSVEKNGDTDTIITYFKPKHPNKEAGYKYFKNQ